MGLKKFNQHVFFSSGNYEYEPQPQSFFFFCFWLCLKRFTARHLGSARSMFHVYIEMVLWGGGRRAEKFLGSFY